MDGVNERKLDPFLPQVSVVMSVYNDEEHLERSITSILDQTYSNFEFIIVNDGSTDGTAEILDRFANQDNRIRLIHQSNDGLTSALILGCAQAKAELIARHDADDFSFPDRLEILISLLHRYEDVVFVSSWANIVGPSGELLAEERRDSDPNEATRLLVEDFLGPPGHGSVMFRKSAYEQVGGYRRVFYYAQDFDLWLRLGAIGKLAYAPHTLYSYEVSSSSISGGLQGAKLEYYDLVKRCHTARKSGGADVIQIQEFASRQSVAPSSISLSPLTERKSRSRTNYFIGRCLLNRGDSRAGKYFLKSLKDYPLSPSTWVSLSFSLLLFLRRSSAS